jgi:hypothetical protein
MKIMAEYVPNDIPYLTEGKEYPVLRTEKRLGGYMHYIIDDTGDEINPVTPGGCAHLNGYSWTCIYGTQEFKPLRYA